MSDTDTMDNLIDKLEADYVGFEKMISRMRLKIIYQDGEGISCFSCTTPHCCSQMVLATPNEGLPIARRLKRDERDTPALREALRLEGDAMSKVSNSKWFETPKPCLFLDGGRCSIYELRPVGCRQLLVLSSPENCAPPGGKMTKQVNGADIIEGGLRQAVMLAKLTANFDPRRALFMVLPLMVLRCLEALDMDDGDAAIDYIYAGMGNVAEVLSTVEGRKIVLPWKEANVQR